MEEQISMDQALSSFMETKFLNVGDVVDGDEITFTKVNGVVESFGKKKFQIEVKHKDEPRILNLYPRQAKQIGEILKGTDWIGKSVKLTKISVNGGFTLNFVNIAEQVKV